MVHAAWCELVEQGRGVFGPDLGRDSLEFFDVVESSRWEVRYCCVVLLCGDGLDDWTLPVPRQIIIYLKSTCAMPTHLPPPLPTHATTSGWEVGKVALSVGRLSLGAVLFVSDLGVSPFPPHSAGLEEVLCRRAFRAGRRLLCFA